MRSLLHALTVLAVSAPLAACAGAPTGSSPAGDDPAQGKTSTEALVPFPPIVRQANLLLNPSFETANTTLVPLYAGFVDRGNAPNAWFAGWGTAAIDWPATSNELSYSTVTTWLTNEVWSGAVAGSHSILVADGTEDGGIAQVYWQNATASPLHQQLTVHAKVLAGRVALGIGNSSQTGVSTTWAYGYSQVDPNANGPQWETVSLCAPPGVNANEVLFYALGAAATYYLDDASVYTNATACP